jgi:hypothetical protein
MTCGALSRRLLASASGLAMVTGFLAAPTTPAVADSYMAGDFHNHTTCTDGTVSIETMVTKSIQSFGLEWLATVDHGGTGTRDCRIDDPQGDASKTPPGKLWEETIGASAIKGDVINSTANSPDGAAHRAMWRWQMIDEIQFPETARLSKAFQKPMLYSALESNVPGHEHLSMTIIGAQRPENWSGDQGNAGALAEFEFRYDRSDNDAAGKGGTPGATPGSGTPGLWTGKVANVGNGPGAGTLMHNTKAVPSVKWLQSNFPLDSYYVPAHVERAGVFDPNRTGQGWNVEHFRDFNNAGPTVAVGFESMPGHQASNTRGEYQTNFCGTGCDSVGVTTRGGVGIYAAQIGGLWDALLGEGRNFFFYASSDWHNRGMFSPFDRQSTQDFYPGEYQKLYIPRPAVGTTLRPQVIVDAVRKGNSFSVSGDLITGDLTYTAEVANLPGAVKAKMGETLVVPRGRTVKIVLEVNLPSGPNNSPYSFNNPSLVQVGIQEPLNRPVLKHVDFIRGNITGVVTPNSPNYTVNTNPSAQIVASFGPTNWTASGQKRTMIFTITNVQNNMYVRARGTNLPPGTPFETDLQGNPLSDPNVAPAPPAIPPDFVPCSDAACPAHMALKNGAKQSSFDVAGWSDLWFYLNPIFIRVHDQPKLLVETNADLAASLRP